MSKLNISKIEMELDCMYRAYKRFIEVDNHSEKMGEINTIFKNIIANVASITNELCKAINAIEKSREPDDLKSIDDKMNKYFTS